MTVKPAGQKRRAGAKASGVWAIGLCLIMALFSGSAFGQTMRSSTPVTMEGLTDPTKQFAKIDFSGISEVASELGFFMSIALRPDGYPFIGLVDENGAQVLLAPMNCTGPELDDTCDALLMSVVIGGLPGINVTRVNRFNDVQFYARGHVIANGRAVMSRLLVADYGIAKGNLALEAFTFRNAAYNFGRYLNTVETAEKQTVPGLSQNAQGFDGTAGGLGFAPLVSGEIDQGRRLPAPLAADPTGIENVMDALDALHLTETFTTDLSLLVEPQTEASATD